MEKTTMRKFRWFWAWQDEAEEAWLAKMAQEGWHLSAVGVAGMYTFMAGEPRNDVYRLDYRTASKMEKQEYLQLFHDAGWEHVGEMGGWQYFRKQAEPGESPEIFTDVESKIEKYKRVLAYLLIFFPVWVVVFQRTWSGFPSPWMLIPLFVSLLILTLFIFAGIRIIQRINQLKRR